MAQKTYITGLVFALKAAHKYATRYQAQLNGFLTTEQYACLVDTIQALASCLALIQVPPIQP